MTSCFRVVGLVWMIWVSGLAWADICPSSEEILAHRKTDPSCGGRSCYTIDLPYFRSDYFYPLDTPPSPFTFHYAKAYVVDEMHSFRKEIRVLHLNACVYVFKIPKFGESYLHLYPKEGFYTYLDLGSEEDGGRWHRYSGGSSDEYVCTGTRSPISMSSPTDITQCIFGPEHSKTS